jgi:hypothetical protein
MMLWRYATATGLTVFIDLVDLTVVTVALPYPVLRLRPAHLPGLPAAPGAGMAARP